jgi:hypothetical protein
MARALPYGRNGMATSSIGSTANLPVFDGFPYLVTRVVPTMYHVTLLSGDASERDLARIAQAQWRANRLDVCLAWIIHER